MRETTRRKLAWLVAAVTLVAHSGVPTFVHAQGARGVVDVAWTADPGRAFDALADAHAAIPRDRFDPGAVAASLGPDPEAAFAFVRDATALVPYGGTLRGPVGVLMDGVGNALDRALLLLDLIERQGGEARLARGALSGAEARALLQRAGPLPGAVVPSSAAAVAAERASLRATAERLGLDPDEVDAIATAQRTASNALRDALAERVERHGAALLDALGTDAREAVRGVDAADAPADHWWVELRAGSDWLALDPSTPDALPGDTWTDAVESIGPAALAARPELAHRVNVRVVLECTTPEATVEHTLVRTRDLHVAAMHQTFVSIEYVPTAWPSGAGAAGEDPVELVRRQDRWYPIVRVGEEATFDRDFTATCEVGEAASPDLLGAASAFGAAAGVFDAFGGGPEGEPSALYLEYAVSVPGRAVETVRRTVFDRVGDVARDAGTAAETLAAAGDDGGLGWRLALLGGTDVLVVGAHLPAEYVVWRSVEALLANRPELTDLAAGAVDLERASELSVSMMRVPEDLLALATVRGLWSHLAGPTFLDRPNVISRHRQARVGGDGALAGLIAFDVVTNGVGVDPRDGVDPWAVRVRQGVLDTNAEALVAALACGGIATHLECRSIRNTAASFDAALLGGEAWIQVGGDDAAAAALPAVVRAALREAVDRGTIVVLPANVDPRDPVWWSVDAVDGTTLGMIAPGWGGAQSEYAMLINTFTVGAGFFFCMYGITNGGVDYATLGGMGMCLLGAAIGMAGVVTGTALGAAAGFASTVASGVAGMGSARR